MAFENLLKLTIDDLYQCIHCIGGEHKIRQIYNKFIEYKTQCNIVMLMFDTNQKSCLFLLQELLQKLIVLPGEKKRYLQVSSSLILPYSTHLPSILVLSHTPTSNSHSLPTPYPYLGSVFICLNSLLQAPTARTAVLLNPSTYLCNLLVL